MLLTWNLLREKSQVSGLNMSFFFFFVFWRPHAESYIQICMLEYLNLGENYNYIINY